MSSAAPVSVASNTKLGVACNFCLANLKQKHDAYSWEFQASSLAESVDLKCLVSANFNDMDGSQVLWLMTHSFCTAKSTSGWHRRCLSPKQNSALERNGSVQFPQKLFSRHPPEPERPRGAHLNSPLRQRKYNFSWTHISVPNLFLHFKSEALVHISPVLVSRPCAHGYRAEVRVHPRNAVDD